MIKGIFVQKILFFKKKNMKRVKFTKMLDYTRLLNQIFHVFLFWVRGVKIENNK